MPRPFAISLGAGAATALLYLSATGWAAGLMILPGYFSMVPVAATGFGLGFAPAATAAAAAAVIVALAQEFGGLLTLFLLTAAGPVLLTVGLSLRNRRAPDGTVSWYPIGRLLGNLTALALLTLAGALAFHGGSPDALRAGVRGLLAPFEPLVAPEMLDRAAYPILGLVGASWIMMIAINCAVGYVAVRRWGTPLRPDAAFSGIDVPVWLLGALAAGAALSLAGGPWAFVGVNAMIIAGLPHFLGGLAVLHRVTAGLPARLLVLGGFYLLTLVSLWPACAAVLLGMAERWLRLRERADARRANERNDRWK